MGLQRVRQDLAIEQQQQFFPYAILTAAVLSVIAPRMLSCLFGLHVCLPLIQLLAPGGAGTMFYLSLDPWSMFLSHVRHSAYACGAEIHLTVDQAFQTHFNR